MKTLVHGDERAATNTTQTSESGRVVQTLFLVGAGALVSACATRPSERASVPLDTPRPVESGDGNTLHESLSRPVEPRLQAPDHSIRQSRWPEDDDDEGGLDFDDVGVGAQYYVPSGIDGGSGKAGILRVEGELGVEYELGSGFEVSLGGEYLREEWTYSGSGTGMVPGAARPWDSFDSYGIETGFSWDINEEWSIQADVAANWAAERGGTTSDERVMEYMSFLSWKATDNLELQAILHIEENHEGSSEIIPIIGFDWSITENDRIALDDRGLSYTRVLSDVLSATLFVDYESESFRLRNNGPVPGGALQREELIPGISVDWLVGPGALRCEAGYAIMREGEVSNSSGRTISEFELDSEVFFGLSYSIGVGY